MSEEEKIRTATDILLDLENKIDNLLSIVKNQDMLLKILAKKINANNFSSSETFKEEIKEVEIKKPLMPGLKPGVVLNIANENLFQQKIELEEVKPNVVTNNRNIVPVSQMITKNGEPIIMADVEIFSINENNDSFLLKKIKTTQSGKWTTSLSPGNYHIVISKKGVGKKVSIHCERDFTINDTSTFLTLEDINL